MLKKLSFGDSARLFTPGTETKTVVGAFSKSLLCSSIAPGADLNRACEGMKNKGTFRESWGWVGWILRWRTCTTLGAQHAYTLFTIYK